MAEETIEGHAIELAEEPPNLPVVRAHEAIVARDEITVDELLAQRDKIVQAMHRAMREGVHYGRIPGIDKPTLYKPGGELLNVLFRFAPSYRSECIWHDDGHLTVVAACTLTHIPSSFVISEGEGLCSTRETKYAYRQGGRVCPVCGNDAIIKGKAEYGGGWLCFKRKGGCGEKFSDASREGVAFETADVGRVDNPDLADSFNTVLKMADKRALIAAVLNGTAASDVFTQDAEDSGVAEGIASSGSTGAGAAAARVTTPEPDPTVLPPVFAGGNIGERVGAALQHIDPSIDWRSMWESANLQMYGKLRGELPSDSQKAESLYRLANVADRLSVTGDFPPPGDTDIVKAFAWAFEGVVVAVEHDERDDSDDAPLKGVDIPDIDDSIEFGRAPQ